MDKYKEKAGQTSFNLLEIELKSKNVVLSEYFS